MNQFFTSGRGAFMRGEVNLVGDNIKCCLLSMNFVGGAGALDSLSTYADVAGSVLTGANNVKTMTGKSVSAAAQFFADPVVFSAITAGQRIGYICIFKDPGGTVDGAPASPASAQLVALLDSGYGLGAGTNGTDVTINWDATDGVLKL